MVQSVTMKPWIAILLALLPFLNGCSPEKPTVRPVSTLEDIQGTWKVVEATDPSGNGYEVDSIVIVIKDNVATSQDRPLRLEFNADGTYLKMFATINGSERQVGEVAVEITTEANPIQMVWMDRANTRQVTLLERQ